MGNIIDLPSKYIIGETNKVLNQHCVYKRQYVGCRYQTPIPNRFQLDASGMVVPKTKEHFVKGMQQSDCITKKDFQMVLTKDYKYECFY